MRVHEGDVLGYGLPEADRVAQVELEPRSLNACFGFRWLALLQLLPVVLGQSPLPDEFSPGPNDHVHSLAVQADGKILVGGSFTALGGQPRDRIARLNPDGSLDGSFDPSANGIVSAMAVQPDGKILVGGEFTVLGGNPHQHIGRLNLDGSLDRAFSLDAGGVTSSSVNSLAVGVDGKIVVGGRFTTFGGQRRDYIARLLPDGTLDSGFDPGASGAVTSLVLQEDGKIVVGGYFTTLGGQSRRNIGRLNPDGKVDSTFDPGVSSDVSCLAVQVDGMILVGGMFATLGGQSRQSIGRLRPDGALDASFHPELAHPYLVPQVNCLALQADGMILLGGEFTMLDGQTRQNVIRLNADGTVDSSFNSGTDAVVNSLAVQGDGRILVGGFFSALGGQPRKNLGRLSATGPAVQSLDRDASTITWLRAGTSPEVWQATFDYSTNGVDWIRPVAANRVPGGWQCDNVSVPPDASIRGQAFAGDGTGSSWLVANHWGRLVLIGQPGTRTNDAGTTAGFWVSAGGSAPMTFQWFKDGLPVVNGGKVAGATNAALTLTNILGGDAGAFHVVVNNGWGSVTSQVATLRVNDPAIVIDPAGENREPGQGVTFTVSARGTEPLRYQWTKDGLPVAGGTEPTLTLTNLQGANAGYYRVVAYSSYGSVTSKVALLTVNLATIDNVFNASAAGTGSVSCLALQADGRILVSGSFFTPGGEPRRLSSNGTADGLFNPGANGVVNSIVVQPDGRILVGGDFPTLGGHPRDNIGRLLPDGSVDSTFDPGAGGAYGEAVYCLAMQPDGRILVGGDFPTLGGQARDNIGRLLPDGTLDTGFNPGAGLGAAFYYAKVYCLAVQTDGRILVGGDFTTLLGGQPRDSICRLLPDGTLDSTFDPGARGVSWVKVLAVQVQPDGRILVGGDFKTLGGQARDNIGRLLPDGTLDSGFNPGADDPVSSLVVQTDGTILVGGDFSMLGRQPRSHIGRLLPDGRPDANFNPGANGPVHSLAVEADGDILVGGAFTTLGGLPCKYIGRLNATGPAPQTLGYDGSTITWLRSGTGPEVWRAIFDYSTNGVFWVNPNEGTRVPGGWEWADVFLPLNTSIRAQGLAGDGRGSGGLVADYLGGPVFLCMPKSITNNAGTTATFQVAAEGQAPLTYQWLRNGVPLAEGGKVTGATKAVLTVADVLAGDAGVIHVVVSNASGSVTSQYATLTVVEPVIIVQPLSQTREPGQSATFSVSAYGTEPLSYQWWKDGVGVVGGTAATLTLTNLQVWDAGSYQLVLSNSYGSVTSTLASVTVNLATLDSGFNPGVNGPVDSLAIQEDGKVVVGGRFSTLGGQRRDSIGRLNPDGTLDSSFNPGAVNESSGTGADVISTVVQADGRIVVGGSFTMLGGQPRLNIGRLLPDGAVETTFNPGADRRVRSLAVQTDGKILVAGLFTTLDGKPCSYLGRLESDGKLDTTFEAGAGNVVYALALQEDGMIVVGGGFSTLRGQPRQRIARLLPDGTLDSSFNPEANGWVSSLAIQADGKIVLGGAFTTLGGQPRQRIARLNPNGTLDSTFDPGASVGDLRAVCLAAQADGKIIVGGDFRTLAGQARNYIGRLLPSGKLDASFDPGADGDVYALAVQADGRLLVGGAFSMLDRQPRERIGRLNHTVDATIRSPIRSGTILAGDSLRLLGGSLSWPKGLRSEWHWELGGGRISLLQNPGLVPFPTPGEHTLRLTLNEADGNLQVSPDAHWITVVEPPGPVPDLCVADIRRPLDPSIATPFDLAYVVRNLGDGEVTGQAWHDAVYLSQDEFLDTTDLLLSSASVSKTVPPGGSYTNTMTVTVPLVEQGRYSLILSVDDEWAVLERHQLNNEAPLQLDLLIPMLTNGVPYTSSFSTDGEAHYFRIDVPPGQNLLLRLNDADNQGINGLYVRRSAVPTRGLFDASATVAGRADQQVLIPAAAPGAYYVMVYAESVPGGRGAFTVEPSVSSLSVIGVTPTQHAKVSSTELVISGAGFDNTAWVELVAAGGVVNTAAQVSADLFTRLTATFDLSRAPVGLYSLRVLSPTQGTNSLADAFEVVGGVAEPKLETHLVVPNEVGYHGVATIWVEYGNTGNASMPAPLLVLTATQNGREGAWLTLQSHRLVEGFWTSAQPTGFAHSIQILASGSTPGVLQPGDSVRVPVYYAGWQQPWDTRYPPIYWNLRVLKADDTTDVDWERMKAGMKPESMNPAAWDLIWSSFTEKAGTTWGHYVRMLDENAAYLGRLDQRVLDAGQVLSLEFIQADGMGPLFTLANAVDVALRAPGLGLVFSRSFPSSISQRFERGAFGWGWSHNWQYSVAVAKDGTATVTGPGGSQRVFKPDSRTTGNYFAQPGDHGTLTAQANSTLVLRESYGPILTFREDGRLAHVSDLNGSRIACGYTGPFLTTLSHSSGQQLSLTYNAQGRIATITDHFGRQTSFTYDADGEHLQGAQYYDGRNVSYSYDLPPSSGAHALRQVASSCCTHRLFTYDRQGRLTSIHRGAGAEAVVFRYDGAGLVTATDALGATTRFNFDHRGLLVKTEDPLGRAVHAVLDDEHNLSRLTDPAGRPFSRAYDFNGNVTRITDPLGHSSLFTYYPSLNQVASITDANGNTTQYAYTDSGNLKSTTYADGSSEGWAYDALGNMTAWTNRRQYAITYTYNINGQIAKKLFHDGSAAVYAYDARGNHTEAAIIDTQGSTNDIVFWRYDTMDRITNIVYADGRFLAFAYDAVGRRASSLDALGHRLSYSYDPAGRLSGISNERGQLLVAYEYDVAGRLSRKTFGNGMLANYCYDAAGQLLSLTNRLSEGEAISWFNYTYDTRGRRTTMTTRYGSWIYKYDDLGQLVSAELTSTDQRIASQNLRYAYDAMGNRISTIENGITSEYTLNNLNQCLRAGPTDYVFDLDGNLIREISPSGTVTYSYNEENRLISVTKGIDHWLYNYDAIGNRVATTENGSTTRFTIDPLGLGNVVAEYDAGGSLLARYDHGLGVVVRTDGAGISSYYTFDDVGNVDHMVAEDGRVVNTYAYAPFGNLLHSTTLIRNPFLYVGSEGVMTEANGLYFMRSRLFDARTGRFLSEDPVRAIRGDPNLYRYAVNDPILGNDPTGLGIGQNSCEIVCGLGGGACLTWCPKKCKAVKLPIPGIGSKSYLACLVACSAVCIVVDAGCQTFCGEEEESAEKPPSEPDATPIPPTEPGSSAGNDVSGASDPNAKRGPTGFGRSGFIAGNATLAYRIEFENDSKATAPAQQVVITDQLSGNLDWTTFRWAEVGFGDQFIVVSPDSQHFETSVLMGYLGRAFEVRIEASLNLANGRLTARFQSIDPATSLPPEVSIGFLPPEDGSGRGLGHVSYTISAKPKLATGAEIRNVALISFDLQTSIPTNQRDPHDPAQGIDPDKECLNTIDAEGPLSRILTLPATVDRPVFRVQWEGVDPENGSGVAGYDIYVAKDAGAWELWLENTPASEEQFVGLRGHSYQFFSVARDNVGHIEQTPMQAQAATYITLEGPNTPPVARDDMLLATANRAAELAVANLLANDFDPDGDPLTITLSSETSLKGGMVRMAGDVVTYTPPTDFIGEDAFGYRVVDGRIGEASAIVRVDVRPGSPSKLHVISVEHTESGAVVLRLIGLPGVRYTIQFSEDLAIWTDLSGIDAGANGEISFTDAQPLSPSAGFYRLYYLPGF